MNFKEKLRFSDLKRVFDDFAHKSFFVNIIVIHCLLSDFTNFRDNG